MTDGRLPRELIDAVTDNLYEDYDSDGLHACSLVCRSWLFSSRRHLFRRVTFILGEVDSEQLAQVLLSSPHLLNYVRELRVCHGTYQTTNQTIPVVLRKLNKLQSLDLRLNWNRLTVDLCQSLRCVFLLPSIKFLTIDFVDVGCMVDLFQEPLTREDQEENEDEPMLNLHRRGHLSHLNLGSSLSVYVDWFLGPRSPFEVSHIQTLRIDNICHHEDPACNRLFRAIGSSLQHVEFFLPLYQHSLDFGLVPEPVFDINLESNPNIRLLRLTNIFLLDTVIMDPGWASVVLDWLLRFFSNIDTDKLEEIQLDVIVDAYRFGEVCSASGWGKVDCVLARKFRKLQKLDIKLLAFTAEEDADFFMYNELGQRMADAHPLLVERGVSVDVGCENFELWTQAVNLF